MKKLKIALSLFLALTLTPVFVIQAEDKEYFDYVAYTLLPEVRQIQESVQARPGEKVFFGYVKMMYHNYAFSWGLGNTSFENEKMYEAIGRIVERNVKYIERFRFGGHKREVPVIMTLEGVYDGDTLRVMVEGQDSYTVFYEFRRELEKTVRESDKKGKTWGDFLRSLWEYYF